MDGVCVCVCVRVCGAPTWYPAAGHLHVELHSVHAQDGVAHVAQQVAG